MNHEDTRRISREELYEQVWSQPMSKLAKNYELSDVGLAKICKKLEIPIPERGYWQRKQHGKKVSRPHLPPANGPSEAVIRINKRENLPVDQKQATEAESRIAFEQLSENRIQVKSTLSSPHPYVITFLSLKDFMATYLPPYFSPLSIKILVRMGPPIGLIDLMT